MDKRDDDFYRTPVGDTGIIGEQADDFMGAFSAHLSRDLALTKAELIAANRRRKIAAYIWSTILFLAFSAIAFYGGFWYAMNYGVCQ